jgi:DNA-binding CsgD family transcriptional regulator
LHTPALEAEAPTAVAGLVEELTKRGLEVLRLIADGRRSLRTCS